MNNVTHDKKFIDFLVKLSKQKEDLETTEMNTQIIEAFPEKLFLKGQKTAKNYLKKLVPYSLQTLNKALLEKALTLLDSIYKRIYDNNATLDNAFTSDIRKPIFTRFGRNSEEHKMSKKLAKLSYKDKGELITESKHRLKERHKEIKRFDPVKILEVIQDSIKTEDPFRKAVGLALASGCRPIELFAVANFEPLEGTKNWVTQDFTAKKRGKIEPVKKPIIGMSAAKFIEQIGDMRYDVSAEVKKVLNRDGELSSAIEEKANKITKMIFDYEDGITLYSCRKIYGQLSYEMYAKDSIYGKDPSIQSWLADVLKHGEDDLTTATSYNDYKPITKEISSVDIANLQAEVNDLKKRLENLNIGESVPAEIVVKPKGAKIDSNFAKIKEVYDRQTGKVTQTMLEMLMKDIVPRAHVRLFYQRLE